MVGTRNGIARQAAAAVLLGGLLALFLGATRAVRRPRADFVFNNGSEVRTLDPAAVTGIAEGRVVRALFEGLTVQDPATLAPLPGMAERWDVSADGRTVTFHLRRDACWIRPGTDPDRFGERGDPLTAHDFVRSWERLLHPATAAEYAYQLWCVRGARAYSKMPDDRWFGPPALPVWMQRGEDGRVRFGLHPAGPASFPATGAFTLLVQEGDELRMHQAVIATEAGPVSSAVAGRVTSVNADGPRTFDELAADPYGAGWLFELAPEPGTLEAALAAGDLLTAEDARHEVFWPRVGIRAADDYTLVVELDRPTPYFLELTGFYPLYPVHVASLEAARARWPDTWETEWVKPERLVTNGPYRILERRLHDRIRLAKNPVYWDADHVAMRTVDILAVEHQVTMLNLYLTGEADWISSVPTNLVPRLMGREDFRPSPQLGTYFYRLNVTRPPLDDARVRRALALAVDRRAICEKILKAGQLPSWGFLPHGWRNYERTELAHGASFDEDCARARELLAEAGYDEGHPLPAVELHYNTSEVHRDIAEVVADGWRQRLGVETRMKSQEFKVFLDTQKTLGYEVSRSSWMGDFVDPVNFLHVFRTGGANNRTGWGSARYDALLAKAEDEVDAERRRALLAEADAILMDELPVIPLFTYVTQNMVNPRLAGFEGNVLDVHFLKFLSWLDDDELAAKRAADPRGGERVRAPGPSAGLRAPGGERR